MKFTEIERLQLEAMGYEIVIGDHFNEIAKYASGSCANYYKAKIVLWDTMERYGKVYYGMEWEEHDEAGEPSDHHTKGFKYVNIQSEYEKFKLAEKKHQEWKEEMIRKCRERRRG